MEQIDKLNEILGYLLVNLRNLKKSPKRQYLKETLDKKQKFCNALYKEALEIVERLEDKRSPEEIGDFKLRLKNTFEEICHILSEKLIAIMAVKLDISLALKLVKQFDGSVTELSSYIESVELLKDYSEGVTDAVILKFLKTTLVGAAHGAIDNAVTLAGAFDALKTRFAIKVTPKAVENEMFSRRQNQKSISDFGAEIEKLAAKLAAAHVSTGTFASEAAAINIVGPIAVQAFVDGLKDPSTKFFIKARNPPTLNKAISDALECAPTSARPNNETTLWCNHCHHQGNGQNNWRGRGNSRGRGGFRGNNRYRGRGTQNNNNYGYNNNQQNNQQSNQNYRGNNRRGRNNGHMANMAEGQHQQQQQPHQQPQQQQQQSQQRQDREEAHLIDLFR